MTYAELDLGTVHAESKSHRLRLHIQSTAQFAPSEKDDIDQLRTKLTAHELSEGIRLTDWVTRGNDFSLACSLILPTGVHEHAGCALIDTLSNRLSNSEFWAHLDLSPTSVHILPNSMDGAYLVKVFLGHAVRGSNPPKRVLHKLGIDIPFHDVQPPPGVSTTTLETVRLAMSIENRPLRHSERRAQACQSSGPEELPPCVPPEHTEISEPLPDDMLLDEPEAELEDFNPDLSETKPPNIFEDEHESECDSATDMLMEEHHECLNDETVLSSQEPSLSGSTSPGAILDLIDIAIRTVIGGASTRSPKGLSIKVERPVRCLADLAPSLWSPGYLRAMSSRAVFLPTISHAMRALLTSQSSLQDLQKTTRKVPACEDVQGAPNARSEVPRRSQNKAECPITPDNVSLRLWKLLQIGLHNPSAAKRLKPLTSSVAKGLIPHARFHDELLDLDSDHERAESSYDLEHDSFLFDEIAGNGHDDFEHCLFELSGIEGFATGLTRFSKYFAADDTHALDHEERISSSFANSTKSNEVASDIELDDKSENDLLSICGSLGSLSIPDADEAEWHVQDLIFTSDESCVDDTDTHDILCI